MKIGVIGAGISGLSIAQMLQSHHQVVVLEKQKKTGGLIKCERVYDCLFHKVGGHVFNAKNKEVFDWFWSFFKQNEEFIQTKRNAKIYFKDKIIGYPIENFLYTLENELVVKIIDELLLISKKNFIAPLDYPNFEEFLIGNFGKTLYEIYFQPYNLKIWQFDLRKVSMQWLEGKLPMPNFKEILQNNVMRTGEKNMVHSTFYYPKNEGSQFIVNRLAEGLNIVNNYRIDEIIIGEDININDYYHFDELIYTGDIRTLPRSIDLILEQNGIDLKQLKALKANGTSTLFCETDDTDISWLYIPESFTKAHRIIYTGNFSTSNNKGSNRKTCVVEFSGEVPYDEMILEIKKLPGNLNPLGANYEKNSYVIQEHGTKKLIAKVKSILNKYHIHLLGRFAEWEYYNMDKAIEAGLDLAKKITNVHHIKVETK